MSDRDNESMQLVFDLVNLLYAVPVETDSELSVLSDMDLDSDGQSDLLGFENPRQAKRRRLRLRSLAA